LAAPVSYSRGPNIARSPDSDPSRSQSAEEGRPWCLAVLKTHDLLRRIPVHILSSSESESDVTDCYQLGANCYIAKPGDLQAYRAVVRSLEKFSLSSVTLPRRDGHSMDARMGTGL
jgi:hypothetical protein